MRFFFERSCPGTVEDQNLGEGVLIRNIFSQTRHNSFVATGPSTAHRRGNGDFQVCTIHFCLLLSSTFLTYVRIRFPECDKISPPCLQLSEASFGYTLDKIILKGINIDVGLDSRIAIVGANGAGKCVFPTSSSLVFAVR